MKYDFDTFTDRRGTASYKWDVVEGELPMWVADMDFKTAPEIREALARRLGHGVFGYNDVPDEWYDAYIGWWRDRHGLTIERNWLVFCTGVVPAISSTVRKLTTPNENVVIQTPVYNVFFNSIINNGARTLESPLCYDGESYHIDFDNLERKLADPQTSLMILCNPHNPVGKIWTREELAKIGHLCAKHGVTVIADEIHCDLTAPGRGYIPFASISEECREVSVTCIAPTKAFNIAGLQTAAVMIPNPRLRHKVWRALNTDEVAEPNSFAVTAAVAAFTKGGDWLDELRGYIQRNRERVAEYLASEIPALRLVPGEATYLLWINCSAVCPDSVELCDFIRRETGLYLSDGAQYGESGRAFIRMNIACPRSTLEDGLARFKAGIEKYQNRK